MGRNSRIFSFSQSQAIIFGSLIYPPNLYRSNSVDRPSHFSREYSRPMTSNTYRTRLVAGAKDSPDIGSGIPPSDSPHDTQKVWSSSKAGRNELSSNTDPN